jgi:hypothetical protein
LPGEDDLPQEHIDGELEEGEAGPAGAPAFLGDDDMESAEASAKRSFDHLSARGRRPGSRPRSPRRSARRGPPAAGPHAKPYPATGHLSALLALLPAEWVVTIHRTLKLPPAGGEELSAGSNRRCCAAPSTRT